MTTEDQIAGLLAQAEPLRLLPDEEAEAQGLPAIVDAINALRAKLSAPVSIAQAPDVDNSLEAIALRAEIAKQPEPLPVARRGRPRNV